MPQVGRGRPLDEPDLGIFVPPQKRKVGYVFQDIRLFGHMSVLENVAFGLRCGGVGRARAREAALRWLERLGAADFAERRADELSGGESQRVALARALACDPDLLLLDEPLAAVDAATRPELTSILADLTRDPRRICVVVTHDPTEARLLAASTLHVSDGRTAGESPLR
ncbi:MAG: hypothetical protein KatS3mg008_1814 [Acidimicrobiales bacterium]|nr:MAG: hypothetical protein KatS3mg008_1814 [Acidimicrobiales bacterium]